MKGYINFGHYNVSKVYILADTLLCTLVVSRYRRLQGLPCMLDSGPSIHVKFLFVTGSEQASEFAPFDENSNIQRGLNLAKSDSVGPVEDVSEGFSKMNRVRI
jgi:hypothetical protein